MHGQPGTSLPLCVPAPSCSLIHLFPQLACSAPAAGQGPRHWPYHSGTATNAQGLRTQLHSLHGDCCSCEAAWSHTCSISSATRGAGESQTGSIFSTQTVPPGTCWKGTSVYLLRPITCISMHECQYTQSVCMHMSKPCYTHGLSSFSLSLALPQALRRNHHHHHLTRPLQLSVWWSETADGLSGQRCHWDQAPRSDAGPESRSLCLLWCTGCMGMLYVCVHVCGTHCMCYGM